MAGRKALQLTGIDQFNSRLLGATTIALRVAGGFLQVKMLLSGGAVPSPATPSPLQQNLRMVRNYDFAGIKTCAGPVRT